MRKSAAEQVEALEALAAEVVLAALEHGDANVRPSAAAAAGTSFVSSCSCSAFVAVATTTRWPELERRDQVGEALAGAGPRLGEQVLAARERVGDRGRERGLLGARLEAGERLGQAAVGSEERIHGG